MEGMTLQVRTISIYLLTIFLFTELNCKSNKFSAISLTENVTTERENTILPALILLNDIYP